MKWVRFLMLALMLVGAVCGVAVADEVANQPATPDAGDILYPSPHWSETYFEAAMLAFGVLVFELWLIAG
jgi:hypothetical protein